MKNNNFVLNKTLENDCFFVADLELCRILLMNRKELPWFILVPRVLDIKEIFELSDEDNIKLIKEIKNFSKIVYDLFNPDKINIAALGNVVPQLHIHIIARHQTDKAWPSPVFGKIAETLYDNEQAEKIINKIRANIKNVTVF